MKLLAKIVRWLFPFAILGCSQSSGPIGVVLNEEYKELTYDKLKSYSGDELDSAVMEHVMWKVGDEYNREQKIVASLPPAIRAVYTTFQVECEVCNGGFNQYFWNSSGIFASEALEGFLLIGAKGHADIMVRAIEIHSREKVKMKKYKHEGTLEAFSESYNETELNKLDDEFYDLQENCRELRVKYISEHPETCP